MAVNKITDFTNLNQTLIYADEVYAFWQQYNHANLSNTFAAPSSLERFKVFLTDKANVLKGEATNCLKELFGVETTEALQAKINDVNNNTNLKAFANKAITNAFKGQAEAAGTDKEVTQALIKYLNSNKAQGTINNVIKESGIDVIIEDVSMQKLAAALNTAVTTARMERRNAGQIVSNVSNRAIKEKITNMENDSIKFGEYKKDVILFLRQQGIMIGDTQIVSTWNASVPNTISLESFYPYFNLLPEEERMARDIGRGEGQRAWEVFKKNLLDLADLKENRWKGENILNQLSPDDFIKKDINGIVGILGEVQAAFMFACILNNNVPVHVTPNLISDAGGKLRADLILGPALGIQVKNYNSYGDVDDNTKRGYHLKDSLPFSTIHNRAKTKDEALGAFLAVQWYNQPDSTGKSARERRQLDKYSSYYDKAQGIYRQALNSFLAANLEAFIQIEDTLTGKKDISPLIHNLFFIFGGKDIVPTWAILQTLANQIQALIDSIEKIIGNDKYEDSQSFNYGVLLGGDIDANLSLYSDTTYSGPKWNKDAQGTQTRLSFESAIWPKIKVSIDLNIYLGDILATAKV